MNRIESVVEWNMCEALWKRRERVENECVHDFGGFQRQ